MNIRYKNEEAYKAGYESGLGYADGPDDSPRPVIPERYRGNEINVHAWRWGFEDGKNDCLRLSVITFLYNCKEGT